MSAKARAREDFVLVAGRVLAKGKVRWHEMMTVQEIRLKPSRARYCFQPSLAMRIGDLKRNGVYKISPEILSINRKAAQRNC